MTNDQHWYLAYGPEMLPANVVDPFADEDEDEARACWFRNKKKLMAECSPGQRPYGFFRFELGVHERGRWFDNLRLLVERDMIDGAEAVAIERNEQMLAPDQSPDLYSYFGHEKAANHALSSNLQELCYGFDTDARKFEAVAAFHKMRNREVLERKYSSLALECRARIAGITTQWLEDLSKLRREG